MTTNVTMIGAGQGEDETVETILDAQQSGRVMAVASGISAALRSLRIQGGLLTGGDPEGAGIKNLGPLLTMHDCTLSNNHVSLNSDWPGTGGVIFNGGLSRLEMTGCSLHDNSSTNADVRGTAFGGAIYNVNDLVLTDCVLRNNVSQRLGGGIYNLAGPATLTNCRVTENTLTGATGEGGGIYVNSGSVTLTESYVWDNTPPDCFGTVVGAGCGAEPPA